MIWHALVCLVKATLAVALFALVSRSLELTGLQVGLIDPLAGTIAQVTGLSVRTSDNVIVGLIAYASVRILNAACNCLATSIHYVSEQRSSAGGPA